MIIHSFNHFFEKVTYFHSILNGMFVCVCMCASYWHIKWAYTHHHQQQQKQKQQSNGDSKTRLKHERKIRFKQQMDLCIIGTATRIKWIYISVATSNFSQFLHLSFSIAAVIIVVILALFVLWLLWVASAKAHHYIMI